MADRRRQRASQDSEDSDGSAASDSAASAPGSPRSPRSRSASGSRSRSRSGSPRPPHRATGALGTGPRGRGAESAGGAGGKSAAESECESEDGIEGDAVLSDYESAEDSEAEEEDYSEEESSKVDLKQDSTDSCESAARAEKGSEKLDAKGAVTGERQSGDGQESTEPVEKKVGKKVPKHLDDDEDRKNPAYIPRKGLFFEHDLRGQTQEEEVRPKGRQRKLWKDEGRWEHDKFREDEQAPKTRQELIALYGYDIRSAHNPDDIKPRRMRKPRFGSPPPRDPNWSSERPPKPPRHQGAKSPSAPPRPFTSRSSASTGRMPPTRNYPRMGGYKETRPGYRASEAGVPHRNGEQAKQESGYRGKRAEQSPPRDTSPELEVPHIHGSPGKEEGALENQAVAADAAQPPPDRPVEKKSYSRARRTRVKAGDAGKLSEEAPASEGLAPVIPKPTPAETSPPPAKSNWESTVESSVDGLEQEMTQMNLTEQNWTPGQSQFIPPREMRGIPNHMHVGTGPPPQFNRMEEMAVPGGRVKRYSSQRQRPPVPEPAPPMHISIMEGHYYDPLQFQGPIYTHGENPAPLPPQGMIVQPEMHLPHPGLHPHQTPPAMANPGLYPPPVSMPPGQPPPQQLLTPTYFSAPGVMNFGNPGYPYPPGALPPPPPPHLYPNTQVAAEQRGGRLDRVREETDQSRSLRRRIGSDPCEGQTRSDPCAVPGVWGGHLLQHCPAAGAAQALPTPPDVPARDHQTTPSGGQQR
ncbi:protein CASC3 isoform X2 [Pipra filicauda]|uniref:Protein CASC3 n=1 Tax=Pipra filicauda TaxID=649802 RepID=A0A6J2IRQ4_9PASS|nr:protein CASC3 isoform X2 [Pipra filicauda]